MTVKALEMVNADDVLSKEKPILIKPNYINASHPLTGITTDSRVIEGVVKFLSNITRKRSLMVREAGLRIHSKPSELLALMLLQKDGR